jgi:hypothetical protein
MKRSLTLLPAAALLFWAAIAVLFGRFLSLGEMALYALAWSLISVGLAGALTLFLAAGYRLLEQRRAAFAPLLLWGLWLALAIWLAVSMISFRPLIVEYRGISNLSSCGEALAAVMDLDVEPTETEPDPDGAGTWYLFEGDFDLGVEEIAVHCDNARLIMVSSRTPASAAAASAAAAASEAGQESAVEIETLEELHRLVHGRFAAIHGETEIRPTLEGFESRWCFGGLRDAVAARIDRMFLIEDEVAELYAASISEGPDEDYHVEVGLSFAGGECRKADSG